ncbi:hypothetical protein [Saccharopolyspora sp. ASAGF58]|uniref:hypothetical protein n=1 Tax=Saccharopolyspora sp. ASAGF58 TaxID=2719023 RepID=UPI001B3135F1|nr:hypothetical protein [Saccharopolyspora sp. ASAGF58]
MLATNELLWMLDMTPKSPQRPKHPAEVRRDQQLASAPPGIANARPLHLLPEPIADPTQIARLDIRGRERLGGILNEYQHAA